MDFSQNTTPTWLHGESVILRMAFDTAFYPMQIAGRLNVVWNGVAGRSRLGGFLGFLRMLVWPLEFPCSVALWELGSDTNSYPKANYPACSQQIQTAVNNHSRPQLEVRQCTALVVRSSPASRSPHPS